MQDLLVSTRLSRPGVETSIVSASGAVRGYIQSVTGLAAVPRWEVVRLQLYAFDSIQLHQHECFLPGSRQELVTDGMPHA